MKTFISISLLLIVLSGEAQMIRYVRAGGTGDGSAWQFSSGDLQNAINASASGDEIWVGAGVYKPTAQITDPLNTGGAVVDKYSTFTMKSGVKIYGSFPATGSPSMNDRNFVTHASTLSGDIGVVDVVSDNCFHVCFFPNTSNVLLDGFVVQGGNANGNTNTNNHLTDVSYASIEIPNFRGSGMYIHEGNNQIHNCYFVDNSSIREGGAVYIDGGSQEFLNNTFSNNSGREAGGGICCTGGIHTFANNLFAQNLVQGGGQYPFPMISAFPTAHGAAIASFDSDLTIEFNNFESNTSTIPSTSINYYNNYGGALFLSGGTHVIQNCSFTTNSSTYLPTGVQVSSGGAVFMQNANSTIKKCDFTGNLTHGAGGAIGMFGGTVHEFSSNRFTNNSSIGNGGALSFAGTNLSAYNNIFDGNSSGGYGAAILSTGSSISNSIVNNTFYENSSNNTTGAAGIFVNGGVHHILNNIFYKNRIIESTTAPGADISFYNSSGSTFLNNLYQTGSSNPNNGNIGFDGNNNPLFVDAENGDFTLQAESPCINAGSNEHYLSSYDQTDFLGNVRIQGGTVDMGAMESPGNTVSISENRAVYQAINIYPNPIQAGGVMQIQNPCSNQANLIDLNGNIVAQFMVNTSVIVLPQNLAAGMYFLSFSCGKKEKLIIR
jgi:hypothetical protein